MDSLQPPGAANADGTMRFLLGSDAQGRDMLSAILYGLRTSIAVGIASGLLALMLGTTLGLIMIAAYFGGWIDTALMRLVDLQLSFPSILVSRRSSPTSRVAALLAGDVDLINYVPSVDVAQLTKNAGVEVFKVKSVYNFMIYPEFARDQSPTVTDLQGKPLATNPLKDIRVRQAISLSVNRPAIVERVMHGFGAPAGQLSPEGIAC